jgi:hypothetical protein
MGEDRRRARAGLRPVQKDACRPAAEALAPRLIAFVVRSRRYR